MAEQAVDVERVSKLEERARALRRARRAVGRRGRGAGLRQVCEITVRRLRLSTREGQRWFLLSFCMTKGFILRDV